MKQLSFLFNEAEVSKASDEMVMSVAAHKQHKKT